MNSAWFRLTSKSRRIVLHRRLQPLPDRRVLGPDGKRSTKGATVQTAVVRPYMPGQAQSVAFLFDGKVFKAFTNMPVWSILLVPNSRIYTAYRQVGKATFEIYGKDGNLLHTWTKLSGTLGTVQDRQAFLKDLTQIRRWKVQIDGAQPYTQIVEGAWESELDGITVDYGGRESFTYDNQAIVKKGKGYQIWWEMTGPREIWVPITK